MTHRTLIRLTSSLASLACLLCFPPANAQFNGHNTLGDFGLASGSQAPPGVYASIFYYDYTAEDLFDRSGEPVLPASSGGLEAQAWAGVFQYTSEKKILGGNYSMQAILPFSNSAVDVPLLQIDSKVSMSISDLYIQPISIGWQRDRADFVAGIGIYAPTGKYEFLGDNNVGLGMWSFELFGGATAYLDKKKSWHFAATAFYETHTKKKDTEIRVGDLLTFEGGLGYSFLDGAANVGLAYYAQWKITDDRIGEFETLLPAEILDRVGKHRVYGAGPELTLPLPINNKLVALVNLRYLKEFGARTKSEGDAIALTVTFPIPSVPLQ